MNECGTVGNLKRTVSKTRQNDFFFSSPHVHTHTHRHTTSCTTRNAFGTCLSVTGRWPPRMGRMRPTTGEHVLETIDDENAAYKGEMVAFLPCLPIPSTS